MWLLRRAKDLDGEIPLSACFSNCINYRYIFRPWSRPYSVQSWSWMAWTLFRTWESATATRPRLWARQESAAWSLLILNVAPLDFGGTMTLESVCISANPSDHVWVVALRIILYCTSTVHAGELRLMESLPTLHFFRHAIKEGKERLRAEAIEKKWLFRQYGTTHDGFSIPPFFRWRKYHNLVFVMYWIKYWNVLQLITRQLY